MLPGAPNDKLGPAATKTLLASAYAANSSGGCSTVLAGLRFIWVLSHTEPQVRVTVRDVSAKVQLRL
jgi:hypothetical protein